MSDEPRQRNASGSGRLSLAQAAFLEKPALFAFKAHSGERTAAPVRACVDSNSVPQVDHLVKNRVSVHHHSPRRAGARQEFFANPAKILGALLFQGNSRPDAGMDKDVVPLDEHVLERFEEHAVRRRHHGLQHPDQRLVIGGGIGFRRNSVAEYRLPAADAVKEAQQFRIAFQSRQEDFFVIPQQKASRGPLLAQCHQAVDHTRRFGTAVDQVAEEDQVSLHSAPHLFVVPDALKQSLEKIETAVNVADRIDPAAFWNLGYGNSAFGTPREEFRNHSRGATLPLMNLDCLPIRNDRHFAIAKRRNEAKRRHSVLFVLAAAFAVAATTGQARAADDEAFESVRAADTVIARIGYRLATANAPLCDSLEPGLGLVLQTPEQYEPGLREEAVHHFHMDGPIGVEAVLPDSPAAAAGIEADDVLVSAGSVRFAPATPDGSATTQGLIRANAALAALPANAPIEIHGRRNGQDYVRTVDPVPACRTRFEMLISNSYTAQSDGEMVQASSRFFQEYPEDQIAALLAHEFAHNILHHRERMEEIGLSFGMLSGFGRNVRYFRETELQADILSVSLLANAGYDPEAIVRFWQKFGPSKASGILLSRSHPAWKDRVATIEKAIADLGQTRPNRPKVLATRDEPLDGNWQALLVRAR